MRETGTTCSGRKRSAPVPCCSSKPTIKTRADMEALSSALRQKGAVALEQVSVSTDHSFSYHRIALQAIVIRWLEKLQTIKVS
jgi:hypothetical protein